MRGVGVLALFCQAWQDVTSDDLILTVYPMVMLPSSRAAVHPCREWCHLESASPSMQTTLQQEVDTLLMKHAIK